MIKYYFFIISFILLIFNTVQAQDNQVKKKFQELTNSFYDNSETYNLPISTIKISGEIVKSSIVDFKDLPKHELIVKETILDKDNQYQFIGAYKYSGYSLYDILNSYIVNKNNAAIFPPLVDVYVEIENDKSEKIKLSWGEIYYTNRLHEIIIATSVSRIVPEKTKEEWVLPTTCKLVFGNDIATVRNISNPTTINIKSYKNDTISINKDMRKLVSNKISIFQGNKIVHTIDESNIKFDNQSIIHTIFYGKGRGLHDTKAQKGIAINDILKNILQYNTNNITNKLIVFVAKDGYRTIYSYSELCNRNDQSISLLLYNNANKDEANFSLYPSCDFFSDRAIKAIDKIIIID